MKFIFARHGNATAPFEGAPDRCRILSDLGNEQVDSVREQVAKKFGGKFIPSVIFTSPLGRAVDTAQILVGGAENMEKVPTVRLPSLFHHPDPFKHEKANALFGQLKYRPLWDYTQHPDGVYMIEIGNIAADQIEEITTAITLEGDVLVVGHAVVLPATLRALAKAPSFRKTMKGSAEIMEKAMALNMGECDTVIWDTEAETFEILSPKIKTGEGEPIRYADEHVLSRTLDGIVLQPGAPAHG